MREIKFRAWDKKRKCMMGEWCLIFFNILQDLYQKSALCFGTRYVVGNPTEEFFAGTSRKDQDKFQKRFEVMQFIDLKDKNEREIYEGDIVLSSRNKSTGAITWDNDNSARFFIKIIKKDEYGFYNYGDELFQWDELEIIGNIFENPELLEAKP